MAKVAIRIIADEPTEEMQVRLRDGVADVLERRVAAIEPQISDRPS